MKQNEFNALAIVAFVAVACMGSVSILGGIYSTLYPTPRNIVCTVVIEDSNKNLHEIVGSGALYE